MSPTGVAELLADDGRISSASGWRNVSVARPGRCGRSGWPPSSRRADRADGDLVAAVMVLVRVVRSKATISRLSIKMTPCATEVAVICRKSNHESGAGKRGWNIKRIMFHDQGGLQAQKCREAWA